MRPKPTNVACTVRPGRRQHASVPKSATTIDSPRMWSALSSSRNPPRPSSQRLPRTKAARAIITTWKKVSPTRKRWRARHTFSGREPPEGTRDQKRRRRVMGREIAKAMPESPNEDSRGYLDIPGAAAAVGPNLVDSVARNGAQCPHVDSRNGTPICAVYPGIGRGGRHARRHLHRGWRRPCHGLPAPVLPEVPSGTVPPAERVLPGGLLGPPPGAQRRHGARPRDPQGDAGRHGSGGHRPRDPLSDLGAPDRRDPRGRLSGRPLPGLQRLHLGLVQGRPDAPEGRGG